MYVKLLTHDDGRIPIANDHLGDSDDLKTYWLAPRIRKKFLIWDEIL